MKIEAHEAPFRTEAGKAAYLDALEDGGPLGRIFKDPFLRLAPAKGAEAFRSQGRFARVFDQTYFAHALNVSVTGSILYEAATAAEEGGSDGREMRIVLAAGALHDFDKLTTLSRGRSLHVALREHEGEARRLVEGYVEPHEVESVLHLALSAEGSDRVHASGYATVLSPRRATLAAWCLQLADRLAGNGSDPNDAERYRKTVEDFRTQFPRTRFALVPEIQVQAFALIPQPSLARAARRRFLDWIRSNGTLLHETERYVSWIGRRPQEKEVESLDEALWEDVRPPPEVAFDKAGISHNAVRTSWTRFVDPTPETVEAWIDHHGGRLVVWQGDWGVRHVHALARDFPGVFHHDAPKKRVLVQLPEDDPDAREPARRVRRLARLVVAHCIRQTLSETRALPPHVPAEYDVKDMKGVMGATVPGILWARAERDDVEAFGRVVADVARLLAQRRGGARNPAKGILRALVGEAIPPQMARTGESCIYCGAAAADMVEDALVFGLKPTAWGPRKKGVQRETHTGRICEPCVLENVLRDQMARRAEAPASDKGHLTVHVHAADLVCNVRWDQFKPLLQGERADSEGRALILFPKGKKGTKLVGQLVPLSGHVSVPMPKPAASGTTSETLAHLYRLRDCLAFVRDTGFKLHVSPLGLVPSQERAQFRWINAPAWVGLLGLAEVHVDRLLDGEKNGRRVPHALRVVEALLRAGHEAGGSQGHRSFISHIVRDPLSVYDLSDKERPVSQDPDHFLNVLEDAYVPAEQQDALTRAALAYIHFNVRGSWSNNTWTWATREYLSLRDKYGPKSPGERLSGSQRVLLVGDLRASAERKWKAAPTEKIEEFVDEMEAFLSTFRGGRAVTGEDRRVLINAISHLARKNYRTVFPKEVPA